MTNNKKNQPKIIYSSEIEEFFWEDSDISVSEGFPVGVEFDNGDRVDLVLCEGIYHEHKENRA